MPNEHVKKIRELLGRFETAMLVTHGNGGQYHARPMAIARVEQNCDVWFFTGRMSAKVDEINHDQHVLIVCQNEAGSYLALRGRARLIPDRVQILQFWKDSYRAWFPKGPEDSELMLIQVKSEDADYWDNASYSSVQYLFEAARAYVRGTQPQTAGSEQHGTVSFTE